jgi:hypothetical protein
MENLEVQSVIFKYTDKSGSFENLPKRGTVVDTPLGKMSVVQAEPMVRFTDGGRSPFEVHLKCRP